MPQPFEHIPMPDFEMMDKFQVRQEAKKINANEKIGDLAHFLVQNFKSECSSGEHVIDTAIRILKELSLRYIQP